MASYYAVLDLGHDASLEDIRASYRNLLLKLHPDKQQSSSPGRGLPTLEDVQAAWSVLREERSRTEYDRQLASQSAREVVHPWESVCWADMDSADPAEVDDQGPAPRAYECRCGDHFLASLADVTALPLGSHLYLPCRTCGNVLEVTR